MSGDGADTEGRAPLFSFLSSLFSAVSVPQAAPAPWRGQLAALWLAQLISALAFAFALPFLPLYIQALGVEDVAEAGLWAGFSSAGFVLVLATLGPLWGALGDRRGPRTMAVRALFGTAVVVGAMGLVANVYQLFALRLLQGAITGVQAAMTLLAAALVPRERLGWSVGLLQMATFIGASVGPLVGGLIADRYGYRAPFAITSGLMLMAGAIVLAAVPKTGTPRRSPARSGAFRGLGFAAMSRPVVTLITMLFLLQFAATVAAPVLPLFIKELLSGAAVSGSVEAGSAASRNAGVAVATGVVLGLGSIFGAMSALGGDRMAELVGQRPIVLAGTLGSALAFAPQALVSSVGQLLALRVIAGVFGGAIIPALQATIGRAAPPERRSAVFGLASTAALVGSAVGPLAGACIAAVFGIPAVFLCTAALMLLAFVLAARTSDPTGSMGAARPAPDS